MIQLPVIRWGQPYESLEFDQVTHFATGEPIAKVGRANAGMIQRDMRKAQAARDALTAIDIEDLIQRVVRAGDLYMKGTLPMGDGTQNPEEFIRAQSASTGLPERLCRMNMQKHAFVLTNIRDILTALTRGLDLRVLTRGYGEERGIPISYQAQTPVLGLVLPSNSPGVHTLWMPIVPMQVGLVLKPGPQEPWTPYRIAAAFYEAGIPREAISLYPGEADIGAAVLESCNRSLIFGGTATVDRYRGNPRVQAHGPGFSKILIGDDEVDHWETIPRSHGRKRVDQQRAGLHQLFRNLGQPPHARDRGCPCATSRQSRSLPPEHPESELAAFTVPGVADSVSNAIDADLQQSGVADLTSKYRHRRPRRRKKAGRIIFFRR